MVYQHHLLNRDRESGLRCFHVKLILLPAVLRGWELGCGITDVSAWAVLDSVHRRYLGLRISLYAYAGLAVVVLECTDYCYFC